MLDVDDGRGMARHDVCVWRCNRPVTDDVGPLGVLGRTQWVLIERPRCVGCVYAEISVSEQE